MLEWEMSNFLNHPDILAKARTELDEQIGQKCVLNNTNISSLPCLQDFMLKFFRMYPAAPLLFPHMSSNDCEVGGYHIPRGTMLLVHVWDIHRDPSLWDDPITFKPERYANKANESQNLMPFGHGRRACPVAGLAQRVVGLTLGTLIQCFD
ncbi:Cytochrome P450 81D1 [Linum perenne]